jgi:hypothetical protein
MKMEVHRAHFKFASSRPRASTSFSKCFAGSQMLFFQQEADLYEIQGAERTGFLTSSRRFLLLRSSSATRKKNGGPVYGKSAKRVN